MTTNRHRNGIGSRRKILVLALLAAFGPAHAADDDVAALMNPDTAVVSAGVGWASGNSADRALFGQYNGLRAERRQPAARLPVHQARRQRPVDEVRGPQPRPRRPRLRLRPGEAGRLGVRAGLPTVGLARPVHDQYGRARGGIDHPDHRQHPGRAGCGFQLRPLDQAQGPHRRRVEVDHAQPLLRRQLQVRGQGRVAPVGHRRLLLERDLPGLHGGERLRSARST